MDAVNDVNAVLYPVEDVLGRYRPRSLAGLKAVLCFCVEQLGGEIDKSDQERAWLAAAPESAGLLARQESGRLHDQGWRGCGLTAGRPVGRWTSGCWAIPGNDSAGRGRGRHAASCMPYEAEIGLFPLNRSRGF